MKNKGKSKNKKIKLSTLIISISIILVILSGTYFILNSEDKETNLTIIEKQWIEKNKKQVFDFMIPSNLSILSDNGQGVFFEFIDKLETAGISINKVAYTYPAAYSKNDLGIYVLKSTDESISSDIFIINDYYVLLSKENTIISSEKDIYGKTLGVLDSDSEFVKEYFNSNVTYKTFSDTSALYSAVSSGEINYGIAPRYYILSEATKNESVNISYSFNNLSNKIVLRLGNNEKLNEIATKYINNFKSEELKESLNKYIMESYLANSKITDVEKSTLTSKVLKYGYVRDNAYNIEISSKLYGLAGEYINTLSSMGNISFEYKEYKNYEDLNKALTSKEVDIAFVKDNSEGYKDAEKGFNSSYVVLANSYQSYNSENSLNGRSISVLENSALNKYLSEKFKLSISPISAIPSKLSDSSLLAIDENYYEYYKSTNKTNYTVLFKSEYKNTYHFAVKEDETVLYNLTNYIMSGFDNNSIKEESINKLNNELNKNKNFKETYLLIILIVIIPFIFVVIRIAMKKYNSNMLGGRKEDILKYSDMLTSLKNRNYLNSNINNWDNTKVYPRTIIIVDLNNVKYVNDNYGHEEGNNLIKKGAAILINTQLEKSEIVRTDGNEFLIYLIGYSKTQIDTYISKLSKAFETLPHGFGAAIGYSMITEEIKTVDDAINEATIDMRIDKEQNYK